MDIGKRKRPAGGPRDEDRNRAKARAVENDRLVSEADVEEFYAILRRMREVSRCFDARIGAEGSRERGAAAEVEDGKGGAVWRPAFAWEDFAVRDAVRDDGVSDPPHKDEGVVGVRGGPRAAAAEERVAENGFPRFFDLNAEPEPEPESLTVTGYSGGPLRP